MKIYSALYGTGCGGDYPFADLRGKDPLIKVKEPNQIENPDGMLIIWGGADIHPSLYHYPNMGSFVGNTPSNTDYMEWALIDKAVQIGMPVLGVCRGAQMGCAFSGGILAQDVRGHGGSHLIDYSYADKKGTILTSSVHHQMMWPYSAPAYEIIATTPSRTTEYSGLALEYIERLGGKDIEIVYFPRTRILAVQGHPEFMAENCDFNNLCRDLINHYLRPYIK